MIVSAALICATFRLASSCLLISSLSDSGSDRLLSPSSYLETFRALRDVVDPGEARVEPLDMAERRLGLLLTDGGGAGETPLILEADLGLGFEELEEPAGEAVPFGRIPDEGPAEAVDCERDARARIEYSSKGRTMRWYSARICSTWMGLRPIFSVTSGQRFSLETYGAAGVEGKLECLVST